MKKFQTSKQLNDYLSDKEFNQEIKTALTEEGILKVLKSI